MINFKRLLGLEYYSSELDDFLIHYRHTHPQLTPSQRQEVNKHAHIQKLRDQALPPSHTEHTLWDKF